MGCTYHAQNFPGQGKLTRCPKLDTTCSFGLDISASNSMTHQTPPPLCMYCVTIIEPSSSSFMRLPFFFFFLFFSQVFRRKLRNNRESHPFVPQSESIYISLPMQLSINPFSRNISLERSLMLLTSAFITTITMSWTRLQRTCMRGPVLRWHGVWLTITWRRASLTRPWRCW